MWLLNKGECMGRFWLYTKTNSRKLQTDFCTPFSLQILKQRKPFVSGEQREGMLS